MSQSYQHPVSSRAGVDGIGNAEPAPDDPDRDADTIPGLELLIAHLCRMAGDQTRSRQYKRRTNTWSTGFRCHQRRGTLS